MTLYRIGKSVYLYEIYRKSYKNFLKNLIKLLGLYFKNVITSY